ncbi:splicing factor [Human mastadenovirus D]|uniref:Splicing factor n=1 Tax=Human mastadenovirus D TaxID=130310 RepID=T1UHF8_9ADEN|nr:splicing factor [Human mastadenovirus D]AGT76372.1 splicing factor [Human mastadenovirus D]AGT76678.1 splicing factor [Human mastadenovirus D]AGT77480.1 splicing factor [Human mastadenovirus D]AGT78049.1 splicing factor [Human mastadenovirus D]
MPRKKQEPLVEEMEEEWDSQAEEDEWEEEEEEELEEVQQEQATEQPVAAPSAPAAPPVKPPRRWDQVKGDANKKQVRGVAGRGGLRIAADEPFTTRELRNRIFPTLYAIFQQSRGQQQELKVKNRSLRSLTRSCLYHKNEDQLQRTLEDAEALFHKYCALTLKD